VLFIGCLIGLVNGVGIVFLGLSPIVMTLATNGILQGLALIYSNGTPDGFSSPMLRWFVTSKDFGFTPVVLLVVVFVPLGVLPLGRTPFGRRVYGIDNGQRVAQLSGIAVDKTLVPVYILSGFCSALVGSPLTGFSGRASLGMGEEYPLPSIAVVVVGGGADPRRTGTLSRHARRCPVADIAADHAGGDDPPLGDPSHPVRASGAGSGHRAAQTEIVRMDGRKDFRYADGI